MVIWPAFRMGQYRVNDHSHHTSQFVGVILASDITIDIDKKHFHFEKLVRFWKAIQTIKDDTVSNRGSKIRNGKFIYGILSEMDARNQIINVTKSI